MTRAVPEDFADVAATLNVREAMERWTAGRRAVERWYAEAGIQPSCHIRGHQKTRHSPPPADLAARCGEMHLAELSRHYGVGYKLVGRWLRQTGLTASPSPHKLAGMKPKPERTGYRKMSMVAKRAYCASLAPTGSGGADALAADYLRRRSPVYRCGPTGAFNPKGGFWRAGMAILTPDELIERARRHGYDPDQWRRIAA